MWGAACMGLREFVGRVVCVAALTTFAFSFLARKGEITEQTGWRRMTEGQDEAVLCAHSTSLYLSPFCTLALLPVTCAFRSSIKKAPPPTVSVHGHITTTMRAPPMARSVWKCSSTRSISASTHGPVLPRVASTTAGGSTAAHTSALFAETRSTGNRVRRAGSTASA